MTGSTPYRMTPFETAIGWLPGYCNRVQPQSPPGKDPLRVLEEIALEALMRQPCVVAFSGGRDSSAVLAITVAVARQHGLPLPVPCSYMFPGRPKADEVAWQERIVAYLGLPDWQRIPIDDEQDVVGPLAQNVLAQFGPVFPPLAHSRDLINAYASGGTVLTGEGGDDVLGSKRSWVLSNVVARRGRVRPPAYKEMLASLMPSPVRRRRAERSWSLDRSWLRPDADAEWRRLAAADEVGEPLDYRLATARVLDRRALQVGLETLQILADRHDVTLLHPLLDSRFVTSYAGSMTFLGPVSRSAAMRTLFGGLLPEEVLTRRSKAVFNGPAVHRHARAFAKAWDGGGVDHGHVDPERLRAEWLSEVPHAGSLALLQSAYVAQQGLALRR
jgi:hypothetical protein